MTGAAPTEGPGLTVVVMAYNEAETVSGVLAELLSALEALGPPHELLIVDDGST